MTPELKAGDRVIDGEVVAAEVVAPEVSAAGMSAAGMSAAGMNAAGMGAAEVVARPVRKRASQGGVRVLPTLTAVLLLATAIFGTLFVRERQARDEDRRHLLAQSARSAQRAAAVAAELAVVRAQRDRLARVGTQALSPAAAAAIRACVQHYADLERELSTPGGPVEPVTATPTCINAEPYVR